jgi:HD-GYP domain-containing protein (c-di-GMP phosphodiesterase class II)
MAALCQAVETKDLYTRGHRERVSRGAVMIGREIGMRASRVEAILYAGMLHDVGKLGVPTTVLRKDGPLMEEEFAAIQLHPMRGLEIVQEIGFLGEALAGIMHGTRPGLSRTTAVAYSSCPAATSSPSSSPLQGRARNPLR